MKNLTPKKLALWSAILIALMSLLIIFLLILTNLANFKVAAFPALFISVFTISYFILIYGLEQFIYRKVKLIYKRISSNKFSDKELNEHLDLNEDIISAVDDEVNRWAIEKQNELAGLKKSEQYRKEFIGNVSHELKTPIFTIQGYVETLLDGAYNDEEVFIKYLRKASKNSERLIEILNDLQTITELESDRLNLSFTSFNIETLTKDVLEDFTKSAKKYNIKLEVNQSIENDFMVYADQEKIRQVLVNLIGNSLKYGVENGKTKVEFFSMDDKILIEITDDGIGISDEDSKRLFERFYRVERSRSRARGGTGLGLSIVKHILEAHNQKINVRSNIGKGSTFAFTLQKG